MASIVPSFVFSGIEGIARSDRPLPERRARAAQRIGQFVADLGGGAAGRAEDARSQLRAMLEEAAANRNRPSDDRAVFREACEQLAAVD
jgi:hypothetical protein